MFQISIIKDERGIPLFGDNPGKVTTVHPYFSLANEVNKAVTAATDILTTDYTATESGISVLMVLTNTAGILSLEVDNVAGQLNGGTNLDAGKWYAFDVPIIEDSLYNLQFSINATLQVKWFLGGVGNA